MTAEVPSPVPASPVTASTVPVDPERPAGPPARLALYRRYRPATFAEVRGQDHVTEPLRQALRTGRVNHAYLFSGPRGCGKTSSARILARSLNCAEGPTPDPCGKCESCIALAPDGPGSLDVIEIDAASHGGVDDARDLRERAFYAPVSGRFKIYIIDEAHMVTREGFNALLKLVEEPPPHLKFVFATTEPEKVIATIRSRTHHYPFRLVPPAVLRDLLEQILAAEQVPSEPAVLPLVVRAGAGSVRDSLSVLDQLLAGSGEDGLRYDRTVALLGYTDDTLLDEVADAFADGDGAAVFRAVNRVAEGGHDPRRFAADLLDRFRDLIVLAAVPGAGQTGLLDIPADRLDRMTEQAGRFGQAELTRAAEIISEGLIQMRGATSPRLLLELMCAQILLPGAGTGEKALLARLERLERRMEEGGPVPTRSAESVASDGRAGGAGSAGPEGSAAAQAAPAAGAAPAAHAQPARAPGSGAAAARAALAGRAAPAQAAPVPAATSQAQAAPAPAAPAPAAPAPAAPAPAAPAPAAPAPAGTSRASAPPPASQAPGAPDRPAQPASGQPASGQSAQPPSGQPASGHSAGPASAQPASGQAAGPGRPGPAAQARRPDTPDRPSAPASAPQAAGPPTTDLLRQRWPEILEAVKSNRRLAWMLLSNATVHSVEDGALTVLFAREGEAKAFSANGTDQALATVLQSLLGVPLRVRAMSAPQLAATPGAPRGDHRGPDELSAKAPAAVQPATPPPRPDLEPPGTLSDEAQYDSTPAEPAHNGLTGMDLIKRELGGQVIAEIDET
jgi:DNA polymerase-3 subunit gamma/tau